MEGSGRTGSESDEDEKEGVGIGIPFYTDEHDQSGSYLEIAITR
jgi:hypothetical protein